MLMWLLVVSLLISQVVKTGTYLFMLGLRLTFIQQFHDAKQAVCKTDARQRSYPAESFDSTERQQFILKLIFIPLVLTNNIQQST